MRFVQYSVSAVADIFGKKLLHFADWLRKLLVVQPLQGTITGAVTIADEAAAVVAGNASGSGLPEHVV